MYIVVETQTTNGVTSVVPPASYTDINEAQAKYHTVLAAAAVSNVGVHACILFDETGYPIMHDCYAHGEVNNE